MRTAKGVLREIRLRIDPKRLGAAEILKDVLAGCGVPRHELVELAERERRYVLFYPKTSAQSARVRRALRDMDRRQVVLEARTLSKKDWQDRWKIDLKPFKLGKNFLIVPSDWNKKYQRNGRIPLIIDSAMAFGSGLHETTRFMVRLFESCQGRFSDFLDIGTGTGILSVAVAKSGVRDIHAIDFNPDCIKVARGNFKRNGCRVARLAVADIHHYPLRKRYDLVAANLVTHNLIKAGGKLVSLVRPGKYLAVSGISLENVPVLKKAFRKYPLRPLKIIKGREWAAVLYKNIKGNRHAGNEKSK